ncbi:hypothetical protein C8Q79DRAFT_1118927, partial [Trametes meyenii]
MIVICGIRLERNGGAKWGFGRARLASWPPLAVGFRDPRRVQSCERENSGIQGCARTDSDVHSPAYATPADIRFQISPRAHPRSIALSGQPTRASRLRPWPQSLLRPVRARRPKRRSQVIMITIYMVEARCNLKTKPARLQLSGYRATCVPVPKVPKTDIL